jgi:hypothetical protein
MAARRLIMVMLGLLAISVLLSFFLPRDQTDEPSDPVTAATGSTGPTGDTGSTGDTGATGTSAPADGDLDGGTVTATLKVDPGNPGNPGESPSREPCGKSGGRLVLTVSSPVPVDVGLPAFGRTGSVTPYAPAVFDLVLPEGQKRFSVTDLETGNLLGEFRGGGCSTAGRGTKDGQRRAQPGPDGQ